MIVPYARGAGTHSSGITYSRACHVANLSDMRTALLFAGQIRTAEHPHLLVELARRLSLNASAHDVYANLSPTHAYAAWHGAPSYEHATVPAFEHLFRQVFHPVHLIVASDEELAARCGREAACTHRWHGDLPGDISISNQSMLYFRQLLLLDALVARERARDLVYARVIRLRLDALPVCTLRYHEYGAATPDMLILRSGIDVVSVMSRRAAAVALQAYESTRRGWLPCYVKTEICATSLVFALNFTVGYTGVEFDLVRPDSTCDQTDEERIVRGVSNSTFVLRFLRSSPCVRDFRHPQGAVASRANRSCALRPVRWKLSMQEVLKRWCDDACFTALKASQEEEAARLGFPLGFSGQQLAAPTKSAQAPWLPRLFPNQV